MPGQGPGTTAKMVSPFPAPGELLPHRPPMLLLRRVLEHTAVRTVCEGGFDEDFARVGGGEVSAAFGLELIAQAAAVHHGLRQRASGQEPMRATRGLLLGSRRLKLGARTLPVGAPLRVTVFDGGHEPAVGGMIRFEGSVEDATGLVLAAGDATVLERRDDVQIA